MVSIDVSLRELVSGEPPATANYEISGLPVAAAGPDALLIGGGEVIATGVINAGEGTIDVALDVEAETYKLIYFPAFGATFPFQVLQDEDGYTLTERVAAYFRRHPDGDFQRVLVPGPPGPPSVRGWVYHERRPLTFTPITAKTADATSWEVTILDDTIDGGIVAGLDFDSQYFGDVFIDVSVTGAYDIVLTVEHHFADGSTISTPVPYADRLLQAQPYALPLNVFESSVIIELGRYEDPNGNVIIVTPEMLESPARIVLKLSLARTNGSPFAIDSAHMQRGLARWTQTGQATGEGPPGPGVATGGTTGQILGKASDADFDTEWVDKPSGDGTDLTVKGGQQIAVTTNAAGTVATVKTDPLLATDAALKAEATAREAADTTLTTDLATEVADRKKADNDLLANVDADLDDEVAARKLADTDEATARAAEDTRLAAAITAQGLPAGGAAGQILGKKSATDYDAEWIAKPSGEGTTVDTAAPISGDGSSSDPITIKDGAIAGAKLAHNAVTADQIAPKTITGAQIKNDGLNGDEIADSSIDTDHLTDLAVTTPKLALGAVTAANIKDGGVTVEELANNAVTTPKVKDKNVTTDKLADKAVTAAQLADHAVGHDQLATDQALPAIDGKDDAGKVAQVNAAGSAWELGTPDDQFTPTAANLYAAVDAILESQDTSGTIEGVSIIGDPAGHKLKFGILREVIETDWGDLPVGFSFRVGRIVSRSGFWFVCIKAHTKGGVGPDNDSTNWDAITLWTGAYLGTRWYHAGQIALLSSGEIAIAKIDLSPNATEPTATNSDWWVSGAVSSAATGHYVSFVEADSPDSGTDYTLNGLRENDILDLTLIATAASSGTGNVRLTPDVTLQRLDDHTARLQASPRNGQTRTVSGQYRYVGTSGSAVVEYSFTGDKPASVTAAAIVPEHTAAFTPSPDNIYPVDKLMWRAGDNLKLTFDDTKREIIGSVRLPDEQAPRLDAIDSRDTRTVQPPYSYETTWTGFTLQPGTEHTIRGGNFVTHGRDRDRPGFDIDTNNGRLNADGKHFTNETAGTTKPSYRISVEITLANERQYSNAETLTLKIYTYGYAKPANTPAHPDNYLTHTKVFNFRGGFQDAFTFDFDLEYTQQPRSGEHDGFRATVEWTTGSGEVVAGIIDAYKHTYSLLALGSLPTQGWTHHDARLLVSQNSINPWIPDELKPEINAAAKILTWAVGTPNNTGRNNADESDKADVLDPLFAFAGNVLDKPFLRAAQDLSRLKLHFAGSADAGGGDVYLCTRIPGYPPEVLANTGTRSGWTLDYTAQGVLVDQDFYLIDPTGSGVGAPTASWDANPGGPKVNNVIDGMIHTLSLRADAGNLTPGQLHTITTTDEEVVEAAIAGLLYALRVNSNSLVDQVSLRGAPRPLETTGATPPPVAFGPLRTRATRTGQWGNVTFVRLTLDAAQTEVRIDFRGTSDGQLTIYATQIDIEYLKYTR